MDDTYRLTEHEEEAAARRGLKAAAAVLPSLEDEEISGKAAVVACLRAFKEAKDAIGSAVKDVKAQHPGYRFVIGEPEVAHVVCSALVSRILGGGDTHPYSKAGYQILALVQAAIALNAFSTLDSAVADEMYLYGTHDADRALAVVDGGGA